MLQVEYLIFDLYYFIQKKQKFSIEFNTSANMRLVAIRS